MCHHAPRKRLVVNMTISSADVAAMPVPARCGLFNPRPEESNSFFGEGVGGKVHLHRKGPLLSVSSPRTFAPSRGHLRCKTYGFILP